MNEAPKQFGTGIISEYSRCVWEVDLNPAVFFLTKQISDIFVSNVMKVIVQEEPTGCGIASVANIVGLSYADVKRRANSLGIFAEDKTLYSDTGYIRKLLLEFGFQAVGNEIPFESWSQLPELALLATKYHLEADKPFWHWAVYKRENPPCVLDSSTSLTKNKITDLSDVNPKWYIPVSKYDEK